MAQTPAEAQRLLNIQKELADNQSRLVEYEKEIRQELEAGNTARARDLKNLQEYLSLKKRVLNLPRRSARN